MARIGIVYWASMSFSCPFVFFVETFSAIARALKSGRKGFMKDGLHVGKAKSACSPRMDNGESAEELGPRKTRKDTKAILPANDANYPNEEAFIRAIRAIRGHFSFL